MSVKFTSHYNKRQTKQTQPIPGENQKQNNAGGYAYEVDKWARLRRFLILGTDGGTYYVRERELTRDNAQVVEACLAEDGGRTVKEIVAVSDAGRAPKNDQAIFALALAASVQNRDAAGDRSESIRGYALASLPQVCRIPTHLFQFMTHLKALRGTSRMVRTAVSEWYGRWSPDQLAYELVKYQSRDGWSHRDVLRQMHITPKPEHQAALRWAIGADRGDREVQRPKDSALPSRRYGAVGELPTIIAAFEEAKTADAKRTIALIREHGLTREMVKTEHLNDAAVWEALLEKMPVTAMVRNLGKMTAVGVLASSFKGVGVAHVVAALSSADKLRKARVHPLFLLNAMRVYAAGHGDKGSLTWAPVQRIIDALDDAFYASFGFIESTGQPIMVALDVSGSMAANIAGTGLSCCEAATALAMVSVRTEPGSEVYRFNNRIEPVNISAKTRLDDALRYTRGVNFGGTDCALPMVVATERKLAVDGFAVYTDSETWAGNIHPSQALRNYRSKMDRPQAAQVVVGMTATEFTIADPKDPRTLDVVGFDLNTPSAIAELFRG